MAEDFGGAVGAFFEFLVAPILVLLGGERLMTSGIDSPSAWILIVVGITSFFVGRLWHGIRPHLGEKLPRGVERIASEVRVWAAIVCCLVVYTAVLTIIDKVETLSMLQTSVHELQSEVERYLLPRHLSHKQMSRVADFLLHFEAHDVTIKFPNNDQEASGYAMDVKAALEQCGWSVQLNSDGGDAREGLDMQFNQTMDSSSAPNDPRHPKANLLLEQAFGQTGIEINSSGSGGAVATQKDSLVLTVGRRRRD